VPIDEVGADDQRATDREDEDEWTRGTGLGLGGDPRVGPAVEHARARSATGMAVPVSEVLRPSEVQWIEEEEALPQLFMEWCEDPLRWAG
jgi:hypothetical protein